MKFGQPLNGFSFHHGLVTPDDNDAAQWSGVAKLTHFQVEENGIRAFRYAGIGKGRLVQKTDLKPIEGTPSFNDGGFVADGVVISEELNAVKSGQPTKFWYSPACAKTKCDFESDATEAELDDNVKNDEEIGNLFHCPHPGCSSSFMKSFNLDKHILNDKHKIAPEKFTQRDFSLKMYAETLEEVEIKHISLLTSNAIKKFAETDANSDLAQGFALPRKRTSKPFSAKVKTFLINCFDDGLKKRAKPYDPMTVAQMMETATNSDGSKMFTVEERLDVKQIAAVFSREARKRRQVSRRKRSETITSEISTTESTSNEDEEDEEEHEDAALIRWLKDPAYMTLADSWFNATIHSDAFDFSEHKAEVTDEKNKSAQ